MVGGLAAWNPHFSIFFTNRLFLPGSTEAPLKHSAAFLVFPRDLLALFRTYKFLDIFSGVVFELGEFENPVNTCFTIHFENIQVPNADLLDVYQTHATCMGLVFNDMLRVRKEGGGSGGAPPPHFSKNFFWFQMA